MGRAYECRGCKARQLKTWMGPCPACRYWCNWREVASDADGAAMGPIAEGSVVSLCDVTVPDVERVASGFAASDRVLGSHPRCGTGLAVDGGQAVQIYGSPGGGKSTWLLQVCREYARQRLDALYIAAEEAIEQIKGRADRIGKFRPQMQIVHETSLDKILDHIDERNPKVVVVDSINEIEVDDYAAGTSAGIKIATREIVKACKERNAGVFIVTQVGKDGDFSGPKALEHLVDTSIVMRGIKNQPRTLVAQKNRFGPSCEAHFRMTESGLVEVAMMDADGPDPEAEPRSRPVPVAPSLAPAPALALVPPAPVDRTVLDTDCEAPDCRGQRGRACTSANGALEVGFHASRIAKAKRGGVLQSVPVEEDEPDGPPDPFGGGGLKGRARIVSGDRSPSG